MYFICLYPRGIFFLLTFFRTTYIPENIEVSKFSLLRRLHSPALCPLNAFAALAGCAFSVVDYTRLRILFSQCRPCKKKTHLADNLLLLLYTRIEYNNNKHITQYIKERKPCNCCTYVLNCFYAISNSKFFT